MERHSDVVVVGGGFSGAAVASVLARNGHSVTLLERQREYEDLVRGEFLGQWGCAEFERMGLTGCLYEGGAWNLKWWRQWDEVIDPDDADVVDMTRLSAEGIDEPRSLSHPATCASLWRAARDAGANALLGIRGARVDMSQRDPVVHYETQSGRVSETCRMVIGAGGRHGQVGKQVGAKVTLSNVRRWGGGLAVEGLTDWPEDTQALGTEGNYMFIVIPRGDGRARLYLNYSCDMVSRFTGPSRVTNFLDAFRVKCIPGSDQIADAHPVGRLSCYPSVWAQVDPIVQDGVVLIGDEAGMHDTILGAGLSNSLQDARMVSEIMCSSRDWSAEAFRPYVAERSERMRRLHISANVMAQLYTEFTEEGKARRRRAMGLIKNNPAHAIFLAVASMGPDRMPGTEFFEYMAERLA